MSGLAQTSGGDFDLSTGNLVVVQDFNTLVAQKLTSRFKLFRGEWFADTRVGVPYYQYIFVKNPNLLLVRQVFRRVITQTPGVFGIVNESIQFVTTTRTLYANYSVQTTQGAILQGGVGQPFIVVVGSQQQS